MSLFVFVTKSVHVFPAICEGNSLHIIARKKVCLVKDIRLFKNACLISVKSFIAIDILQLQLMTFWWVFFEHSLDQQQWDYATVGWQGVHGCVVPINGVIELYNYLGF